MNGNILVRLYASLAILAVLTGTSRAVVIATVPVGSPGNSADSATGSLYGSVPYNYRIGTYDVTDAQYAVFLNAKASTADPYGLWNSFMNPPGFEGAISRSGSGPYSYSVKVGYANKPVLYVSWYSSIRFVNWLTNGQGNGDTENGTYTITNGGNNSGTVVVPDATQRASWATTNSFHWLLPSDNEWYKAAYYNAQMGTYYAYPFQSNSQPTGLVPPGNANSGDFSHVYNANGSSLTDVGAYPNSLSPFGSFDMGGDLYQWNEADILGDGSRRGMRGGFWSGSPNVSAASFLGSLDAAGIYDSVGFRVASVGGVPEPRSVLLALIGLSGLVIFSKRLRTCLIFRQD
jgi:sulfatase modifying factor 1